MGNNVRIPQELHAPAQRLRAAGKSYREISEALGVSETSVRRMVGALEVIRVVNRQPAENISDKATVRKLLKQIPPDTRSLTARIAGDPLKGRSALDQQGTP
jgi:predicted AAA+ superfamily ATPase